MDVIAQSLPKGLYVDTYENKAYIGIVPFQMRDVRPKFLPAIPRISNMLELNLRTYVYDDDGIPGVWFYSLDANKPLAVKLARYFFYLSYFQAEQHISVKKNQVTFTSLRNEQPEILRSSFIYAPKGEAFKAEPSSMAFFFTSRYILFAHDPKNKRLYRGRIYHKPYQLSDVFLEKYSDVLFTADGFSPPMQKPDHMIMSKGVDVKIYKIERI